MHQGTGIVYIIGVIRSFYTYFLLLKECHIVNKDFGILFHVFIQKQVFLIVWIIFSAEFKKLPAQQILMGSIEEQRLPDEIMEYFSFYVKFLLAAHLAADIRRYRKNRRGIPHHGMGYIVPFDAAVKFHLQIVPDNISGIVRLFPFQDRG